MRYVFCAAVTLALLATAATAWAGSWEAGAASAMGKLAELKDYKAARQSSYDPSGGNKDGRQDWPIEIGETRTMAEISGAGAITHIWVTIASRDPKHLRNLVLRMYWDGEESPSVESPIGDFFGLGHALYYQYASLPIQIGTSNGLNCFWRMPFGKGAKITVTNEGTQPCRAFYYYVDYQVFDSLPDHVARFHAQYVQSFPCPPGENYTILDAKGRGHYVGTNLSIKQNADEWWGEGDDMIYVDGETDPTFKGTGSEDYFCGAWCYGPAFSNPYFGCPLRGEHKMNSLWNVYRYHIEDPIPFEKSIRVTIEHGHANDRRDDFASVAYWYQTEPHAPFPPLPKAEERLTVPVDVYHEPGAEEAEDVLSHWQGGDVSRQDMSAFGAWSNFAQMFFLGDRPRSYTTTYTAGPDKAGTHQIRLWHTKAPDYGDCELYVNGEKVAQWDGYRANVSRHRVDFPLTLKEGENTIELRIVGKSDSSTGYLAGIDCWHPLE